MSPEIQAWLKKAITTANTIEETEKPNLLRGMFYCSEVGWELEKIKKMVEYMREYGEPEETIDDIRYAWKTWQ